MRCIRLCPSPLLPRLSALKKAHKRNKREYKLLITNYIVYNEYSQVTGLQVFCCFCLLRSYPHLLKAFSSRETTIVVFVSICSI